MGGPSGRIRGAAAGSGSRRGFPAGGNGHLRGPRRRFLPLRPGRLAPADPDPRLGIRVGHRHDPARADLREPEEDQRAGRGRRGRRRRRRPQGGRFLGRGHGCRPGRPARAGAAAPGAGSGGCAAHGPGRPGPGLRLGAPAGGGVLRVRGQPGREEQRGDGRPPRTGRPRPARAGFLLQPRAGPPAGSRSAGIPRRTTTR